MKINEIFLLLFLLLTSLNLGNTQNLPTAPTQYTAVTDLALLLNSREEAKLSTKLKAYFDQSSNQLVIVLVESLDGNTVENSAQQIFQTWGIGQKGKDNGLLFLISKNDHKIRIHTGYGLENALPDAFCNRIIEEILQPNFRANKYFLGLDKAIDMVIGKLKGENIVFEKSAVRKYAQYEFDSINNNFYLALMITFLIVVIVGTAQSKIGFGILNLVFNTLMSAMFVVIMVIIPSGLLTALVLWIIDGDTNFSFKMLIGYIFVTIITTLWITVGWKGYMAFINAKASGSSGGSSSYSSSSYSNSSSSYSDYSDSFGGGSSGGGGASGSW